jgi:hypothetical protein
MKIALEQVSTLTEQDSIRKIEEPLRIPNVFGNMTLGAGAAFEQSRLDIKIML